MEQSTTYQAIVRRGRAEQARRMLLLLGEAKFGPPDVHRSGNHCVPDTTGSGHKIQNPLLVEILRQNSTKARCAYTTPIAKVRVRC